MTRRKKIVCGRQEKKGERERGNQKKYCRNHFFFFFYFTIFRVFSNEKKTQEHANHANGGSYYTCLLADLSA